MGAVSIAMRGGMVVGRQLWEVGIWWWVLTFCGWALLTFCWCWRECSRRKTLLALMQEGRKTLLALEREWKNHPAGNRTSPASEAQASYHSSSGTATESEVSSAAGPTDHAGACHLGLSSETGRDRLPPAAVGEQAEASGRCLAHLKPAELDEFLEKIGEGELKARGVTFTDSDDRPRSSMT
jgi:hypothetical protein